MTVWRLNKTHFIFIDGHGKTVDKIVHGWINGYVGCQWYRYFARKKNGQKQKWLTAFYLFNPEEGFGARIFVSIDALRT